MEVKEITLKESVRQMQELPMVSETLEKAKAININIDSISSEINKYHATTLELKSALPEDVGMDSTLQNPLKDLRDVAGILLKIQSWKDRLVYLYGVLHAKHTALSALKHRAEIFLKIEYQTSRRGSKTETQEIIDLALFPIKSKRDIIISAEEYVNLVLSNLTSSYYTYKNVEEISMSLKNNMVGRGGTDYHDN